MTDAVETTEQVRDRMVGSRDALYRYARSLGRNRTDAQDLVQDTYVRALSKIDQFQPGTNLQGWLLRIMWSIWVNANQKNSRVQVTDPFVIAEMTQAEPPRQEDRLKAEAVIKALNTLPEVQAKSIRMVCFEGHSYDDTALIMGVAPGTLRSRMSRGRAELARQLEYQP